MDSNFAFLTPKWALLAQLADQAEAYAGVDPNVSLMKARQFVERLCERIILEEGLPEPEGTDLVQRLRTISCHGLLSRQDTDALHEIRRMGNRRLMKICQTK